MEDNENKQISETAKETMPPIGGIKMKFIFTFFGIGSLLTWNAILSDLAFFINYQSDYQPGVSFSFLNFSLNIVFQFLLLYNKDMFPMKFRLIFGLIFSIVSLVILPIIVISFEKNSLTGFIFTAVVILFQGLVNALCCSGFFALSSFFPLEMIIALSSGQGVSGILMNVIQYIVLLSVDTGDKDNDAKYGALIFFSISGFVLLICLFILFYAYKTEYFSYYLEQKETESIDNEKLVQSNSDVAEETNGKENVPAAVEIKREIGFLDLFYMLKDIDLLSCYIYIITFALFPNVSISQRLFETGIYRTNTIITIYNVFDTIGRMIISKIKPTKKITYLVVLIRTVFLFTFIFNYYCDAKLEWGHNLVSILLIINIIAFATTNGMATSLCLGIAPTLVPDEIKGRAGSSVAFFNILGIFLGTCVAFGSTAILDKIGKLDLDSGF